MKKLSRFIPHTLAFLLASWLFLTIAPFSPSYADYCTDGVNIYLSDETIYTHSNDVTITATIVITDKAPIDATKTYYVELVRGGFAKNWFSESIPLAVGSYTVTITAPQGSTVNVGSVNLECEGCSQKQVCNVPSLEIDVLNQDPPLVLHCTDGDTNYDEEGEDCGGADCPPCDDDDDDDVVIVEPEDIDPSEIRSSTGDLCQGLPTVLGLIPIEAECLVKWLLKNSIILGGGIAFLLSLWGGITIIFAAGNPEKINEGRQIITSALSGLLVIILAIFLLRLIGYDILQLPGFGYKP